MASLSAPSLELAVTGGEFTGINRMNRMDGIFLSGRFGVMDRFRRLSGAAMCAHYHQPGANPGTGIDRFDDATARSTGAGWAGLKPAPTWRWSEICGGQAPARSDGAGANGAVIVGAAAVAIDGMAAVFGVDVLAQGVLQLTNGGDLGRWIRGGQQGGIGQELFQSGHGRLRRRLQPR